MVPYKGRSIFKKNVTFRAIQCNGSTDWTVADSRQRGTQAAHHGPKLFHVV